MFENLGEIIFQEYGSLTSITIIIGFIATLWKQIAIEEEKTQNTKDIKRLEDELLTHRQQLEHTHQISQVTYQKLFEKKIEIYKELLNIQSEYLIKDRQNILTRASRHDNTKLYTEHILQLAAVIKENELFISNDLVNTSEKIITKTTEEVRTYFHNSNLDSLTKVEHDHIIFNQIKEKIKKDFCNFKTMLDNDILKIKRKINLD